MITLSLAICCDPERVDTEPLGATEAIYFSNVTEFRTVLTGVYAKLHDYYFFNVPGFGNWVSSLWLLPGDDLSETQGVRTPEELFDGGLNPTNGRIEWVYDNTYEIIQKANVLIEKVHTVDYSAYEGAEEISFMEGEALFLRGYAYFNLFNMFGDTPIITTRLGIEKTNIPKSDKIEVLTQVVDDMRLAIGILPDAWPSNYAGRITKNSARGMLIKALVFRANYTGDANDFNEAISVYNSISVGLQERFLDNFDSATENNAESLFEFQASTNGNQDNIFLYNDGPWRGADNLSVFRGMSRPDGGFASLAFTRFVITNKLFNLFGTDPRISYFLKADDGFEGRIFQKYTLQELDQSTDPFTGSLNNERVLRMADIELLVAESYLKTSNTVEAINHVNKIRTRARLWAQSESLDVSMLSDHDISETNSSQIMQWIMDERFVELAGEGQRWWDLKRWHVSADVDLTGWDGSENYFSTELASPVQFDVNKHLLFPLPQAEVERNLEITENNPGY
ncbi:RagB/SusD family nutrient uptake outer membrane protein [Aurantibacter crassamenti]|uniref:RagB/SusD family nutrient uptake outer membrane protein n=1 Tax=Aurantibacter crassamenti TaxID=1837375 RepID=UPI00193987BA|nr:RagB/SusD family nutrient uptake outer membrane protein [Aurantibacter crassamenti]MBM1105465.1 RagB/SusD family nutrient uptake outer membrane protein [Aurantibacter crassamenti]